MEYVVYNSTSGITLWQGEADSAEDALNKSARDAGYDDYDCIADEVKSENIVVEPLEK